MPSVKKTFRIFISSCSRLLEQERRILSDVILSYGHLPIRMESNFNGVNTELSIKYDKEKLEESDCVIFILSHLYGEVIRKKIGGSKKTICPFYSDETSRHVNCDSCFSDWCHISFTHFEYLYAKHIGKPIFVIFNTLFDDKDQFEVTNNKWLDTHRNDDCKELYFGQIDKNKAFVDDAKIGHSFPYGKSEEFMSKCHDAVRSALDTLSKPENTTSGLVPYCCYHNAVEAESIIKKKIEQIRINSVEEIYVSQNAVLDAIAQFGDQLYIGNDGAIKQTRVLAIRGDSFHQYGKQWGRYVLVDRKINGQTVPVEFILGNENNEEIVKGRFKAFRRKHPESDQELEAFRKIYLADMENVHRSLLRHKENYLCELWIHNMDRLPFRMVFIGDTLFLSSFLSDKQAEESPVFKIQKGSSLYLVCDEYYNWVKELSIKHPNI